jgi:hypothetical protein
MEEQSSEPLAPPDGRRRSDASPPRYALTRAQIAIGASVLFLAGAAWGAAGLYLYQSRPEPCAAGMTDMDQGHAILEALEDGESAAKAVTTGGEPDLLVLDQYAEMLEAYRVAFARGKMTSGWIEPTEEDVAAARHLVQLVRGGAPRGALVEPARRVYRITADPGAMVGLCHVLPWLAGEATRVAAWGEPDPKDVRKMLDEATAFFERGGNVRGFVPTPEDLARVRRLRELVTAGGGEELAERQRLAKELSARLAQNDSAEAIRRMVTDDWPRRPPPAVRP